MSATMSNVQKAIEMGRRVGLSQRLSVKIYMMGLQIAARQPMGVIDMVQVACAIKYASTNKHLLKPEYRYS